jgi:hypothetical protein
MTTFRNALAGLLLLLSAPAWAQEAAPFEARLDLLRNDKLAGEMTFELESDADSWTMSSETRGVKGLARLLGLHEQSVGHGDWVDAAPRPLRYERTVDVVRTLRWSAAFDWSRNVVHTVYPDGESTLELPPGAVDEAALGLVIRQGLARGASEWRLPLVDEDEIENAHFRTRSVEKLQTALGCVTAHVVEKVRREGSRRYTRTYYSAEHRFAPVRMEHGKQGGDRIEARIVSLTLADDPVRPGPDCAH